MRVGQAKNQLIFIRWPPLAWHHHPGSVLWCTAQA